MDVRQVLSGSGPVARALGPSFESRPEQIEMAEAVATAMETRSHLVVEAGTGVGKSFAYLVPAMLRALERGERVVIATNTISLQEQLIQKDIPFLRALLAPETVPLSVSARPEAEEEPGPGDEENPAPARPAIKAVLVKGRGNYVSIRRLRLASQRQDKLLSDAAARRSLHAIEDWALETTDGTLSTLPPLERPGVWDKVESDSGNCMGRKCPSYRECFYQRARAEMESANILVCNHALFFSDLALRSQEVGFLPTYQHVILDEAHNVEDVASEHFGLSIAEGRVFHLLSTLYGARSGKGYLPHLQLLTGDLDTVDRAIRLVMQADAAARGFFDSLVDLTRRGPAAEEGARKGYSPGLNSGLRIRAAAAVENVLSPVMRELSLRLKALRESVKNDADKYELNSYSQRAAMIADDAEMLLDQSLPGCAYWAETGGQDDEARYRRVTLACAPVEVAPLLKERLFGQDWSVVLTSATLATRQVKEGEASESAEMAFAHVLSRLGCEGARTLQLGSPFDHARQVELYVDLMTQNPRNAKPGGGAGAGGGAGRPGELRYVPDDGPGPVRGPGAGSSYTDQLAERILHHVGETDGGAFVLFTSFASLNAVASRITGPLAARGIPVLAQGRDGPRSQILERFRESERSVLLGAASFWQGVDVRGRGLRNVIITKLPFDPPDRPLTEARGEVIEARGGDAFGEDSLPRAVIRFKQGFGRLIRAKSDHGRVVVLDPRILTARYGRVFLAALPKGLEARILRDQG